MKIYMNMTVQITDKGNVIIQFLKRVTLTKYLTKHVPIIFTFR